MINKEQVDSILQKSRNIEKQIEDNKKQSQELSNKLIELNTKKQQVLDELNKLGITENELDSKIEQLYNEVQDGIRKFEELNK